MNVAVVISQSQTVAFLADEEETPEEPNDALPTVDVMEDDNDVEDVNAVQPPPPNPPAGGETTSNSENYLLPPAISDARAIAANERVNFVVYDSEFYDNGRKKREYRSILSMKSKTQKRKKLKNFLHPWDLRWYEGVEERYRMNLMTEQQRRHDAMLFYRQDQPGQYNFLDLTRPDLESYVTKVMSILKDNDFVSVQELDMVHWHEEDVMMPLSERMDIVRMIRKSRKQKFIDVEECYRYQKYVDQI